MRVMMTEDSNNAVSSSFLLDDDSRLLFSLLLLRYIVDYGYLKPVAWQCTPNHSIPFSVDDISKSMTEIEVTDVDMPPLIRENSGFTFLHQRKDWQGGPSCKSLSTFFSPLNLCITHVHTLMPFALWSG